MTNVIRKDGKTCHQCEECELVYENRAFAEQCQAWCREHKSCNLEIIKHAVHTNEEPHQS